MTTQAVFVDLPNIYGSLIRSGLGETKVLREYFLTWLDLDLLATNLTGALPSIWVFYSSGRIGPSEARVDGQVLKNYVNRINSLDGVTARDVNIPGDQRETLTVKCDKCGQETITEWRSEKGIDASLTVHLFDTMESWDIAYLLSGDADFVPAVASLRRRGKIVIGVGFSKASSALIQESYSYINLADTFVRGDVALFKLFSKNGVLTKWFNSVEPEITIEPENLKISLHWSDHEGAIYNNVYINIYGSCNVEGLKTDLTNVLENPQFKLRDNKLADIKNVNFSFAMSSIQLQGLKRKISGFVESVRGLHSEANGYTIDYRYNADTGKYEAVTT